MKIVGFRTSGEDSPRRMAYEIRDGGTVLGYVYPRTRKFPVVELHPLTGLDGREWAEWLKAAALFF